jgi:hypothetical protein
MKKKITKSTRHRKIILKIRKSTHHKKIIGDFGEALVCNWLSRSDFEVTIVDHTGIDVLAYHSRTKKRLGISVKSRTREKGKEADSVNIFSYRKVKNDRQKAIDACKAFEAEPWIAIYVETTDYADLYLLSLKHYDRKYRINRNRAIDDWKQDVIEFNRLLDNNSIKLFSFEIKKNLTKGNYRESFFQAVSNSSWAHEGYLVAADITQDDDLLAELDRLSASFGIGIINLKLTDFDSSCVLFPAKARQVLDWETVNKLCDQNRDFEKFIQDVKIDFESKRVHSSEYDTIIKDPIKYIKDKLNIEQED